MVYPKTPFDEGFDTRIVTRKSPNTNNTVGQVDGSRLDNLFKWLCSSPKISTIRVNALTHSIGDVIGLIKRQLTERCDLKIEIHPDFPDVIVIYNCNDCEMDLGKNDSEVIVDVDCGAAILRGAHIFAPGVLGMQSGVKLNEKVSIYVDIEKKCKKGYAKRFDGEKIFIANGIARMTRNQLFGENVIQRGVAVKVYSNISGCPSVDQELLPKESCLLQNLPSIICAYVLSPKPKDVILDMCASPGNKTSHIAALMKNEGILVAIDKTPSKVKQLKATCDRFHVNAITFQADSTKIVNDKGIGFIEKYDSPPFQPESFDKILLDAPCSALGKRPQFRCNSKEANVKSFVPLQRKLFENAVKLLKVNGRLVYSTCTITLAENEGIVSWALNAFDCLKLTRPEPYVGSPGWPGTDLTDDELRYVQRFDDSCDVDSVGFFIASFAKTKSSV